MTDTPRLGITQLEEDQALPEVVVNEGVATLEIFATRAVLKSKGDNAPPGSPAAGDAYLIGGTGTGAWAGHDNQLTWYSNGAWEFLTPKEGWEIEVEDEDATYVLRGGSWVTAALGALDDLSDVDVAAPGTGDVLTFDGAEWTASPPGVATFSGAIVKKAADQTTADYSAFPNVTWDAEEYDTDAYHDTGSNTDRLTVPANGYYKVGAQIVVTGGTLTTSDYIRLAITRRNSADVAQPNFGLPSNPIVEISANPTIGILGLSMPISCQAGDYFTVSFDTETDTSITVQANSSWFGIYRVG